MIKVTLTRAAVAAAAIPFPKVSDFNLDATKAQLDKFLESRPGGHRGDSDRIGADGRAALLFEVRVRKAYLDWFKAKYPELAAKWNFWLYDTARKFFSVNKGKYPKAGDLVAAFIKQFKQKDALAELDGLREATERHSQVMDNFKAGTDGQRAASDPKKRIKLLERMGLTEADVPTLAAVIAKAIKEHRY